MLNNYALEPSSVEGIRNIPKSDHHKWTLCKVLSNCSLRGLESDFLSVERHLSSLLFTFFSQTQMSQNTNTSSYQVFLQICLFLFRSKTGCCAYVLNDITCFSDHGLESLQFLYHLAET